ncbi:MAG: FkbM family methyltransferase [Clostridiales Family XIII bacterium]|jgi:FkbM family methyltransferase|nr:FkbM family methyltransferase [Clostridiales Family XIII bacterium]
MSKKKGDFSAISALKGATAYAFELNSLNYKKLLSPTAKINSDLSGKIILIKKGLSDGKKVILSDEAERISTGTSLTGKDIIENENNRKEEIELTTIDDFVHENNLSSIDFIKADIEGAERLMLKGAKNTLKDFGPKLAICTYHLPGDPEVLESLIHEANSKYVVEHKYKKLYAYIPKD